MEYVYQVYEAVGQMTNVTATFDSATNMFPIFASIVLAIGILALLFYASASIEKFRKLKRVTKVFKFLYKSLSYAAYGGLTVVVIGGPVLLAYNGFNAARDNAADIMPGLIFIGKILLVFVGLALLGWFMKTRVWGKLFKYHKEEKQIKDNIKELPGMIENINKV